MIAPYDGSRIRVREHTIEDLDAYTNWQCSESMGTYLSWLPRSKEEAKRSLEAAIRQQTDEGRKDYYFAVEVRETGVVVGNVGVSLISKYEASIGWFILEQFQGKGFGIEAAGIMLRMCMEIGGLRVVRASCRRENLRSERIMKTVGFVLERSDAIRVWYTFGLDRLNQTGGANPVTKPIAEESSQPQ